MGGEDKGEGGVVGMIAYAKLLKGQPGLPGGSSIWCDKSHHHQALAGF